MLFTTLWPSHMFLDYLRVEVKRKLDVMIISDTRFVLDTPPMTWMHSVTAPLSSVTDTALVLVKDALATVHVCMHACMHVCVYVCALVLESVKISIRAIT